jgi:hypothetical protein
MAGRDAGAVVIADTVAGVVEWENDTNGDAELSEV